MARFLTFALAAPIGAMGALAVGERRSGWDRPGRSALLGLVAGCLGIERDREDDHLRLSDGLGVAIRREGPPGVLLVDYHTAQMPGRQRKRSFPTRRAELLGTQPETVLSRREYRVDVAFSVCMWERFTGERPWTLEEIEEALRRPKFVPYLGRRSCALCLPLAPLRSGTETVREAFLERDRLAGPIERDLLAPVRRGSWGIVAGASGTVWADVAGPGEPPLGLSVAHSETRRDALTSRRRWQFDLREEVVAHWHGAAA